MIWKPPEAFEEYKLIELLGRGGMGAVYLARDTILDRAVAIKFIALEADRQARDRFVIEARAIARIQHPNVVAIYRVGQVEGRPFIVSELVRGKRLDLLAGSLSPSELLDIAMQLSRGLAVAHRRGVLHRDLKPENAMLAEAGEVKLLDFGIAKLTGESDRLTRASGFLPWNESTAVMEDVAKGSPPEAQRLTDPDLRSATLPGDTLPPNGDPNATASIAGVGSSPPPAVRGPSFRSGERARDEPKDTPLEPWWSSAASPSSPSPTHAGAVMGTPYYIAPEIWQGESATPRSDVYSLGALLYMLAANKPPHEGENIHAIADQACRTDAPPVAEAAPQLPESLAAIIDRCLARDPAARFADGDAVREALEALASDPARGTLPPGNPYRGLAAFEAEHRGLFFGRGREIRAVTDRLRSSPLVLVAGDSGVGKSSLLRAGVLPQIEQGSLGDGREYLTVSMMPSHAPWTTFIARLGVALKLDDLEAEDDPLPIARALKQRLKDDTGVLVLIDQLEELVTLSDPHESALLSEALALFRDAVPGLRVAASVRADFLAQVSELPGLGEVVDRSLYLLRPMDSEGIREAITGPAAALGFSFETDDIVDDLAAAAGSAGGLPLLQFTLAELWERRDSEKQRITRQAIDELGGVDGALSRHADSVIAGLRPGQRKAARPLLVKLVATTGTRERLSEAELCGDSDDARAALDALVRGRLITAREAETGTELELAHESLITGWSTLASWLSEDSDRRAVMERLRGAAREWERLGRAREALWQPRQLAELSDLEPGDFGASEAAFAAASRRAVHIRKAVRWGSVLVALLAVVGAYFGVRIHNERQLARKVDATMAAGENTLVKARALAEEGATLRQAAFAAFDSGDWDLGETKWAAAQAKGDEVDRLFAQASGQLEHALMLDPDRTDTRALLAQTIFERLLWADRIGENQRRDELTQRLAVYDSGALRAKLTQPATLAITTTPADARVTLAAYEDRDGRLVLGDARALGHAPIESELPRGSYMLILSADGYEPVRYPVALQRAENLAIEVPLPAVGSIPEGFVFIPPGRFFFGAADPTSRDYLKTVPLHQVQTGGYLIAKTELTFGDYIQFLDAIPPKQRALHTPGSASGLQGMVELSKDPAGKWVLRIQPAKVVHTARAKELIYYASRSQRAKHDWLKMPVSGISFRDAKAYAAWLDESGKVPGARLCTELEWERAARGADARIYPHGHQLAPGEANFDATYDLDPDRYGPDEVGSYPASVSPFGLFDMAGNVWDVTRSTSSGKPIARGGSFPLNNTPGRVSLREQIDEVVADITLGVRICANAPVR